ncbi:MAG TPA: hypothetical protein VGL46_14435 [Pseudonocardiaceae bacterium]|jgi:hypothetical protein
MYRPESARTISGRAAPALRAVANASASRLAAPRTELVALLRRLVAVSVADSGMEILASSALKPLAPV